MDSLGYWLFLLILYMLSFMMKKRKQKAARQKLEGDEENDWQTTDFVKGIFADFVDKGEEELDEAVFTELEEELEEENEEITDSMQPRLIVKELDKNIVGQPDAKRAVAVALRNRWRRQQVDAPLRDEINPNNIILIGSTGVGKLCVSAFKDITDSKSFLS